MSLNKPRKVDCLDADYLRQRLDYNPETGSLLWRSIPENTRYDAAWNKRHAGHPAFKKMSSTGYKTGRINGVPCSAHQIIWKMMTGETPYLVDHINQDKTDNRWCNLRLATNSENMRNKPAPVKASGLPLGVTRHRKAFRATIKVYGRNVHLGSFACPHEAAAAYQRACVSLAPQPTHVPNVSHADGVMP